MGKEREGSSRNVYKGPMGKDKGKRLSVGVGDGWGGGKWWWENRDNCT